MRGREKRGTQCLVVDNLGNGLVYRYMHVIGLLDHSEATTETEHQVEGRLLLDVVVRKSAAVLKLLAGEDEALLIGMDAFLVLDLGLDVIDGIGGLDLKGNGLASEGLHENLHTTTEAKDQVEGRLLLDVVV